MNVLIFEPSSRDQHNCLRIHGQQHAHIKNILKAKVGAKIKVGELNGLLGQASVVECENEHTLLEIEQLGTAPPPQLPLTLILALPRPQMIKRSLQNIATLGIQRVMLIQSNRVEKSFWQSPVLSPDEIRKQLILGLEQAGATQLPKVEFHPRFIPFMEDVLPQESTKAARFIAEPGPHPALSKIQTSTNENILAIGPEGGFIEKEVCRFTEMGFTPVSLGERILKVETAVVIASSAFLG